MYNLKGINNKEMNTEEINKRNEAIVEYLGYVHKYSSIEDFSDIGGLETDCMIYSKIPLKIDYSIDSQHWVNDRDQFIFLTISGWDVDPNINELKYHSSWDWLMPVVEKIEAMGFEIDICQNKCLIMNDCKNIPEPITKDNLPYEKRYEGQASCDTKIEAVFLAVSDYCLTLKKE